MHGVDKYLTSDGISVLRVHYSADPARDARTPEGKLWRETELRGYPGGKMGAKWRRENEIDFEVQGGELVFPMMENNRNRIIIPKFEIPQKWRVAGSFDYAGRGITAFLTHAWDPEEDDYYTIWEYYKRNSGYINTAEAIKESPYFDRLEWIVADPSIWTPTQEQKGAAELVSVAQLFAGQGIIFTKGKRGGDAEFAEIIRDDLWSGMEDGDQPRYRIFPQCVNHYREMMKWRYAEYANATQAQHNLKETMVDKDNHSIDAAKYFMSKVKSNWMQEQGVDISVNIVE